MADQQPQLQMLWPETRLGDPLEPQLQDSYVLRTFDQDQDLDDYLSLMHAAGFAQFDEAKVEGCLTRVLPNGFFLALHQPSNTVVATAMATHNPKPLHPYGGELGWVAGRPDHAGKGLGTAVCAAVVQRFLSAGYKRIYLLTDDWRLPALKVYLKLGFIPFLFAPEIAGRWETICRQLDWPYTPDVWPSP